MKTLEQEQKDIDDFHNNESFDLFETLAEIFKPEQNDNHERTTRSIS